jgi:hypothetical protein
MARYRHITAIGLLVAIAAGMPSRLAFLHWQVAGKGAVHFDSQQFARIFEAAAAP